MGLFNQAVTRGSISRADEGRCGSFDLVRGDQQINVSHHSIKWRFHAIIEKPRSSLEKHSSYSAPHQYCPQAYTLLADTRVAVSIPAMQETEITANVSGDLLRRFSLNQCCPEGRSD
jgi:hypothetical protein